MSTNTTTPASNKLRGLSGGAQGIFCPVHAHQKSNDDCLLAASRQYYAGTKCVPAVPPQDQDKDTY